METKHFVDTHTFLWYLAGSSQLGSAAKGILQDPTSELYTPIAVIAEACWIIGRGRVALTASDVFDALDNDGRFTIVPLDRIIVERSNRLTALGEVRDLQMVASTL